MVDKEKTNWCTSSTFFKNKDYPVYEIFEADIKDVPTYRFSTNLDEEYKELYEEINKSLSQKSNRKSQCLQKNNSKNQNNIDASESSLPLEVGPAPVQTKPKKIPNLNLNGIIEKQIIKEKENSSVKVIKREEKKVPMSARISYPKPETTDDEGEGDWSCSYCMEMNQNYGNEDSQVKEFEHSERPINLNLSPEEREERNRRIEELLKKDRYENYQMIKDLNKMQELAESFSKQKQKK